MPVHHWRNSTRGAAPTACLAVVLVVGLLAAPACRRTDPLVATGISGSHPGTAGAEEGTVRAIEPAALEAREIEDDAIALAVHDALASTDGVPAELIDVEVNEGVVTLKGIVDNLIAEERAIETAQNIRGVRAVVERIEVDPPVRPDEELAEAAAEALARHPVTESMAVNVLVDQARVLLRGTAHSWQEKELATSVVREVRGVREVQDEIALEYPESRPDEEIRADIVSRLTNDVRVDSGLIDVLVDDGRVELEGAVGSAAERNRAIWNAWALGVQDVDASDLEVQWWARDQMKRDEIVPRSEEEVEEAVLDTLERDPRVLGFRIDVDVEEGAAVLTGVVETPVARRAAEEDARNTVGVWRVRNYIRVRPEEIGPDPEILAAIEDALGENPYLDPYEILVTGRNGHVRLSGRVDDDFERRLATEVVERVPGVIDVDNELTVVGFDEEAPRLDWMVEDDIEERLWWDPFVDSRDVGVEVRAGVATLRGTVDDWRAYQAAIEGAYEAGARRVIPEIEVEHGPPNLAP